MGECTDESATPVSRKPKVLNKSLYTSKCQTQPNHWQEHKVPQCMPTRKTHSSKEIL